jgi:hypothetical protein
MAELVGYQLVGQSGNVVQSWGGVFGQVPGVPSTLSLPNGDQVEGASLGATYSGCTLRAWMMEPPVPTSDQVDIERERRIALPLSVSLSVGNFTIDMDGDSQRNLGGLATAGILKTISNDATTLVFRDHDNVNHNLGAADLIAMGVQVQGRVSAIYAKSWALKTGTIPADFAADGHWQ